MSPNAKYTTTKQELTPLSVLPMLVQLGAEVGEGPGGGLEMCGQGLMLGDKPPNEMRIWKIIFITFERELGDSSFSPHISSSCIHLGGIGEATGQLLDSSQASGGRREKEGGQGGRPRETGKAEVQRGLRMQSHTPCQTVSEVFFPCRLLCPLPLSDLFCPFYPLQ